MTKKQRILLKISQERCAMRDPILGMDVGRDTRCRKRIAALVEQLAALNTELRRASRALTIASPERVPSSVATCPECGAGLWWQVTTTDGLRDLQIDCETEDTDDEDSIHRGWQSDWQPVIDAVRRWLGSGRRAANDEAHRSAGKERGS